MTTNQRDRVPAIALLVCLSVAINGCAWLAEQEIEQDLHVFEADLGMFRSCLKQRGGSCQGSDTTALPHSSQAELSSPVIPVNPGSSRMLADSVAKLPAGHPAKTAHAVLSHGVVKQAAALHNHLRGHATGSVEGVSVEKGQGDYGGPQSTVKMGMKIGQTEHFQASLSRSTGTTAWDALHNHCLALRAPSAPAERQLLEADCRRVAFIRGYLGAYFRNGEFFELDINLSGVVKRLDRVLTQVTTELTALENQVALREKAVKNDAGRADQALTEASKQLVTQLDQLLAVADGDIVRRIGGNAESIVAELAEIRNEASARSNAIAWAVASASSRDIQHLASDMSSDLAVINQHLAKLQAEVSRSEQALNNRFGGAAGDLHSNVLKVSNIGFLSRDSSFQARVATVDISLNPTALQHVTVSDADRSQMLTSDSGLNQLSGGADRSGVGTGATMGAEVVRIFFEALFDAHEGLPAIAAAGVTAKATGLTLGEYSLPVFNSPMGNVDSQDFSDMTTLNTRLAAKVRIITGRVVSGIGPLSLNNPSLENMIVEIITTSVRKATEKASWCWYACNLNVASQALEADTGSIISNKISTARSKLEASARQDRSTLRTWQHKEAEQVKLRLHLGE